MGIVPGAAPGRRAPAEAVNGRGEDHTAAAMRKGHMDSCRAGISRSRCLRASRRAER